jgi:hypothetical protein
MLTGIVRLAVLALILFLSNHAIAEAAPPPNGESNIVLNRQLAAMVFPAPPRPVMPMMFSGVSPRAAVDQRTPSWLTSPAFLAIAEHFTSAERVLHYRHGGFDANFWGALNRRHSIRIEFSARL